MPNTETEFLLIQIFGRKSYPMLKFLRMQLWFTRFKNINPYPVPRDLPQDPLDLAKLGLRHMEPDLSAKVTVYQVCIPVYTCRHPSWLGFIASLGSSAGVLTVVMVIPYYRS